MKLGGYYTVEATFVVTICLWVLIGLCYTGLYVHDSLLLESEINGQTAAWISDGGGKQEKWEKLTKKKLQKKMFLMRIQSVKAKKGLTCRKITIQFEWPVSWKKLRQIFSRGKKSPACKVERETVRASHYLWDALTRTGGEK